jgi:quercetin dioxygenase-like cupin family protein
MPAQVEIAANVQDFAQGAMPPVQTHPGLLIVTVLAGAITFRTPDSTTVYQVGQSFVELPNVEAQAANTTSARTSVMVSYVVPQGAPLAAPVQHAGPEHAPSCRLANR